MNKHSTQTVTVDSNPSTHSITYAEVLKDAEVVGGEPFVDDKTPEGHFGQTVKNIGGTQVYWFKGEKGDPEARVVARTQYVGTRMLHYIGGRLFGGQLVVRLTSDS